MSCNTAHWAVAKLLDPGKSLPSFRPLMTAHFDLCPNAAKIGARGAEMLFFVLITDCCCGQGTQVIIRKHLEGMDDDQCWPEATGSVFEDVPNSSITFKTLQRPAVL